MDDGTFYRKALYLMVKTMVSCRFSLKPIHWNFDLWDLLGLLNIDSLPGLEAKPQGVDRLWRLCRSHLTAAADAASCRASRRDFGAHIVPRGFTASYLGKTCLHFWDDMQNDVDVCCHQEPCASNWPWLPTSDLWKLAPRAGHLVIGRHPTSGVAAILSWRKTRLRAAIVCKEEASTDLPTLERVWNRIKNLRTLLLLQGPR